jgi:uncharacterized membrane protein
MAIGEANRSMSEVVQDIFGNVQEMIRSEFRLAKAEVREEASKGGKAAAILGAGALAGIFCIALFLVTCLLALEIALPAWLAALIMGILTGIVAAVLIKVGRTRLKRVNAMPRQTIHSVKENVEWARGRSR